MPSPGETAANKGPPCQDSARAAKQTSTFLLKDSKLRAHRNLGKREPPRVSVWERPTVAWPAEECWPHQEGSRVWSAHSRTAYFRVSGGDFF